VAAVAPPASRADLPRLDPDDLLNISKLEQRTLHTLAQGGQILIERDAKGAIAGAECFSRDGWRMEGFDLALFRKLKRRGLIASRNSGPYRVTREGLFAMRPQLDNRVTAKRW
jgi:uncharacterized protein YjhX (UPF0386 family)